jgi:hypothetical protein
MGEGRRTVGRGSGRRTWKQVLAPRRM